MLQATAPFFLILYFYSYIELVWQSFLLWNSGIIKALLLYASFCLHLCLPGINPECDFCPSESSECSLSGSSLNSPLWPVSIPFYDLESWPPCDFCEPWWPPDGCLLVVLNEAHFLQRVGNLGAALPLQPQAGGAPRVGFPWAESPLWAEGAPPPRNCRIPVETGELIPIGPYWVTKQSCVLCVCIWSCMIFFLRQRNTIHTQCHIVISYCSLTVPATCSRFSPEARLKCWQLAFYL